MTVIFKQTVNKSDRHDLISVRADGMADKVREW